MTAISQWHMNINKELYKAQEDEFLYVTRILSERLSDELNYSEKLESIILGLEIAPVETEVPSLNPPTQPAIEKE